MKDAFGKFLVPGKPGYVPHQWAALGDALAYIKAGGGIAVLDSLAFVTRVDWSQRGGIATAPNTLGASKAGQQCGVISTAFWIRPQILG